MKTLQHTLCNLIRYDGNIEEFKKEISFSLLPDAIRWYIGFRQYSHFVKNYNKTECSWYKYPTDIKNLTKEKALNQLKYLANNATLESIIGEKSDIQTFIKINNDLPVVEFYGIMVHLIQDYIFDDFLLDNFNISNNFFEFQGKKYNLNEFRNIILDLEDYGFYILSYYCYKKYGIITNQEWFDKNIFDTLVKYYPIDLALNTYKYMKIPPLMNIKISNAKFDELIFPYYNVKYTELYSKIIYFTKNIDDFLNNYYLKEVKTKK